MLVGCRSQPREEAARATLVEYGLEELELLDLKLTDLRSVSAAAQIGMRKDGVPAERRLAFNAT